MEMKINLNEIFDLSKTSTPSLELQSEDLHNSSIDSSQTLDFKSYFKIDIFDENQPTYETNSNENFTQKKHFSKIEKNTQMRIHPPGSRLYYESQSNLMRKKEQIQKIKQQQQEEEKKQRTFKPVISKNSQRILEKRSKRGTEVNMKKKKKEEDQPSDLKKLKQSEKECTFKPMLVSKTTKNIQNREKQKVFEGLFQSNQIKQAKKKLLLEEEMSKRTHKKKGKSTNFDQFLNRNNEYKKKVQKKQELILKTSQKYDLGSGKKMFTPETCSYVPKSSRFKKYFQADNTFQPKPIFQKNHSSEAKRLFETAQNQERQFHAIDEREDEEEIVDEAILDHIHGETTKIEGGLSKFNDSIEHEHEAEETTEQIQLNQ